MRVLFIFLIIFIIISVCDASSSSSSSTSVKEDPRVVAALKSLKAIRESRSLSRAGHQHSMLINNQDNEILDLKQHQRRRLGDIEDNMIISDDHGSSSSFGDKKATNINKRHHHQRQQKLLIVMLDAFRFDYPDLMSDSRGFSRLLSRSARAPSVIPVFPSKTYPNMYSQVIINDSQHLLK